jgi:3-hydroxybutyryl-CoA dehydrogenase
MDQIGLDVIYDIEMSYFKNSSIPDDKPPDELKKMVEKGDLGVKSGKGFYNY